MLNCAQAVVVVINSMAVSRICFSYFSLLGITVSRTCHVSCRRKSMRNLSFRSEKVITEMLLK